MKRETIIVMTIIALMIGSGTAGWFLRDYIERPSLSNTSTSIIADYIVTEGNAKTTIQEAINTLPAGGIVRILPSNYNLTTEDIAELNKLAELRGVTIIWNFEEADEYK